MADYRLRLRRTAAKAIDAIGDRKVRSLVVERIRRLIQDPRPAGCEKLAGEQAAYRVHQGDYRIIYIIDDRGLVIEVVTVGHRPEVYR